MRASVPAVLRLALVLAFPAFAQGVGKDEEDAQRAAALKRAAEIHATATQLLETAKYDEAERLLREALELRERWLDPGSADLADTLGTLAVLLRARGQYAAARPLYERALEIDEKALGPDHPGVATDLNNLALLLYDLGQLEPARPLYERALAIREKALGQDHAAVGESLNNLALLLCAQGRYETARPLYERALAIFERALGPEDFMVAVGLNNLAELFKAQGRYEAARPLYERSIAVREKARGPGHPAVAISLNNLADLLKSCGEYETARDLYERALAISEKALGADHPQVATGLNNLAMLLQALGQLAEARSLLDRALAIREKALGPEHRNVAQTLNNLALLLVRQRQEDAAQPLYERALRILEKAVGPEHPDVALALANLASLYQRQGRLDAARQFCDRALAIREKAFGPDHPDVALGLNSLARLLESQGAHDDARPFYERALAIRETAFGSEHPSVAVSLNNLALLHQASGRPDVARALLDRALAITESRLKLGFISVSGAERLDLVRAARHYLDSWLVVAREAGLDGYAEVLRFKGIASRAEFAERALVRSGGEALQDRRLEILAVDRTFGGLARRFPRDPVKREEWRKNCAELSASREALLLDLARTCAPFREALARSDPRLDDLKARLGAEAALLDFLRTGEVWVAWVVRADAAPVRVGLGSAAAIDAAAEAFTRSVARGEDGSESGARLAALVLAPLRPHLAGGTRRLWICPDAALAAVPFAALPAGKPGSALLDEFEIAHLEMAQDLVPIAKAPAEDALVVGGVDYEGVEGEPRRAGPHQAETDGAWPRLPATEREAALLRALLGERATVLAGAQATESRFRELAKGKGLLHLATHGYVREDRLAGLIRREDARRLEPLLERQISVGLDPMVLSGVALAGANQGGASDDGLLTAAEVSWLDLERCDLVVLSACDTGRGTVAAGEGTLGLVRGFRLAGARTVVASLWRVDDDATLAWMERFYGGLLGKKLDPAQALREAALGLRDFRGADGRRPFGAPRHWAAFVAYGR